MTSSQNQKKILKKEGPFLPYLGGKKSLTGGHQKEVYGTKKGEGGVLPPHKEKLAA